MKGYVVSKSLQDVEITPQEGMQIYWEGWNTYINNIEGDKAILAQDMFQGLIPISALNTIVVECQIYPTPQKDGLYTEYDDRTILYGSWASRLEEWREKGLDKMLLYHPLKYSDWQTAIDQELINSGKEVEFNIWNEVDEVARIKALTNRNEGENDWEVEYVEVATLVPQQDNFKKKQKELLEEITKESEEMGLYDVKPPELPTDLDSLLHEFSKRQVKKKQQYAEKGIWVTLDNFTDFVDFLQQKHIKVAQREIEALLIECKIQFEYLNDKFGQTGTTNSLLAKIESYLYL